MRSHRVLALLFIGCMTLFVFPQAVDAKDKTTTEVDQAFEQMLRGIDTVPTRAAMEKRWPDIHIRLSAAAKQSARDNYTRSRAISLLSFFADVPAVKVTLKTLVKDPKARIRSISIYTLARAFGDPGDKALVGLIEGCVSDKHEQVRTHAIRSLRWVRHERSVTLLKRIVKNAAEERLRRLAERTLEKRRF